MSDPFDEIAATERILASAEGYLALGMLLEAEVELNQVAFVFLTDRRVVAAKLTVGERSLVTQIAPDFRA